MCDDGTAPASEPDDVPMHGRGRYELLNEHGRGGVGRVWRARDLALGRVVALKEIIGSDEGAHPRFMREVLATARLEHPGIVPIYEAGRWSDGRPFYVMRMVAGRTLADVTRGDRTLADRIERLPNVIAVADTLAYAHARRVVHRDLKPSNVIVGEFGETVVIDWGLAKPLAPLATGSMPPEEPVADPRDTDAAGALADEDAASATRTGTLVGTPAFMAPEQASGAAVDERTDVFAIGALLYFVLSGKKPYEGANASDVLAQARDGVVAPLEELEPRVPPDLAAIVGKAMAMAPSDRYPSARELATDLKRFQAGQLVAAHDYSLRQKLARWIRRNRAVAIAVALFVVIGLVGVTAFVRREQGLRKAAEDALVRADESTLALLEQQGRTELAAGRPLQAAAYLVEAYRRRPASRVLAALATQATRPLARLSRSYVGHAHDIPYVSFSPDGARFVTSSTDGTSRIWQTQGGTLLATLNGGDKLVDAATFSPDGERVAMAADRVRMFTTTGTQLWSAEARAYRVWFTPDGRRVLVGSQRGQLTVFDAATGAQLADTSEHQNRIEALAFSPDGARFAVASWDRTVTLWDAASVKVIRRLTDHEHDVTTVAWSADGRFLASADMEGEIQLRRGDTGERIRFIRLPPSARIPRLWFDPDGQTLIVTAQDGSVRRIHLASGVVLDEFDSRAFGKLMASALSSDGRTLVTTGVAGRITLWNLAVGSVVRVLAHPVDDRAPIYFSELTHDRQRLVTASEDGVVRLWDGATGAILQRIEVPRAERVAVAGDGRRVLVATDARDKPPVIVDATTGDRIATVADIPKLASGIASSRDGRAFALSLYDGTVRVIDAATGAETARIAVDTGRLSAVTFDPDGNPVAAGESGKVWMLDRATRTVKRSFAAHTTWIQDLEFSADGKRLVTAGRQDHTVKVWDAATGALQLTLSGHKNNVMRASFSPDGTWIATTGVDNTAMVWDATTGELAWTFVGPAYTAEWSADGNQLFTTGIDGFAAVFSLGEAPRSPDALAGELAARSPWVLVDGRLQPR